MLVAGILKRNKKALYKLISPWVVTHGLYFFHFSFSFYFSFKKEAGAKVFCCFDAGNKLLVTRNPSDFSGIPYLAVESH